MNPKDFKRFEEFKPLPPNYNYYRRSTMNQTEMRSNFSFPDGLGGTIKYF